MNPAKSMTVVPWRMLVALAALLGAGLVSAQTASPPEQSTLPDLSEVNRPPTQTQRVEVNAPRTPSFSLRESNGIEIDEYREPNKPLDIEVRSGMGTRYNLNNKDDVAPPIRNGQHSIDRVPSVNLLRF